MKAGYQKPNTEKEMKKSAKAGKAAPKKRPGRKRQATPLGASTKRQATPLGSWWPGGTEGLKAFETLQKRAKNTAGKQLIGIPPSVRLIAEASGREVRSLAERINWGQSTLGIPQAWTDTQGGGVKVAVLDTGVDPDHPDLQAAIDETRDFTGDGMEDVNGHGTHCAGVIGARANGSGFVGVAPQSRLLIGKVLGNRGSGTFNMIARGVEWAQQKGADVISMSLGGPGYTQRLFEAVHDALAAGIVVVCAAGNEGSWFQNSVGYPGKFGGVITVAAHDRNGNPAGFSSRGGEIDFMAPGVEIWSTFRDGGYAALSGTSMATPFVSGVAALCIAKHKAAGSNETPIENTEDMRNHLMRMASHPGHFDGETGYGLLRPLMHLGS